MSLSYVDGVRKSFVQSDMESLKQAGRNEWVLVRVLHRRYAEICYDRGSGRLFRRGASRGRRLGRGIRRGRGAEGTTGMQYAEI